MTWHLLELFSRGRVLRRRLPADVGGGTIFVSPDSALQFWKRGLEKPGRDLFDFAKGHVRKGNVVWDIGANVGLFAFAAAHVSGAVGTVLAVEPDLFCAGLMARTRAEQPASNARVVIVPVAIGDRMGIADFNIAGRGRSSNYLAELPGSTQAGGVREKQPIPMLTLDALLGFLPPPAVLKIDVETAEILVLRGAQNVLSLHRPVVLCEVTAESRHEATTHFKSHGYRLFDWSTRKDQEIENATWMTLAIPPEKR